MSPKAMFYIVLSTNDVEMTFKTLCEHSGKNLFNKGSTNEEIVPDKNIKDKIKNNEDILYSKDIEGISNPKIELEEDIFEDAKENILNLTMLADNLNMIHLSTPIKTNSKENSHEFSESRMCVNKFSNKESTSSNYEEIDYIKNEELTKCAVFLQRRCTAPTKLEGPKNGNKDRVSTADFCEKSLIKPRDAGVENVQSLNSLTAGSIDTFCLITKELIDENVNPFPLEQPINISDNSQTYTNFPKEILNCNSDLSEDMFIGKTPYGTNLADTLLSMKETTCDIVQESNGCKFKKDLCCPLKDCSALTETSQEVKGGNYENKRSKDEFKMEYLMDTSSLYDLSEVGHPCHSSSNPIAIETNYKVDEKILSPQMPCKNVTHCDSIKVFTETCEKEVTESNNSDISVDIGRHKSKNDNFKFDDVNVQKPVNDVVRTDTQSSSYIICHENFDIRNIINDTENLRIINSEEGAQQPGTSKCHDMDVIACREDPKIQYITSIEDYPKTIITNSDEFIKQDSGDSVLAHLLYNFKGDENLKEIIEETQIQTENITCNEEYSMFNSSEYFVKTDNSHKEMLNHKLVQANDDVVDVIVYIEDTKRQSGGVFNSGNSYLDQDSKEGMFDHQQDTYKEHDAKEADSEETYVQSIMTSNKVNNSDTVINSEGFIPNESKGCFLGHEQGSFENDLKAMADGRITTQFDRTCNEESNTKTINWESFRGQDPEDDLLAQHSGTFKDGELDMIVVDGEQLDTKETHLESNTTSDIGYNCENFRGTVSQEGVSTHQIQHNLNSSETNLIDKNTMCDSKEKTVIYTRESSNEITTIHSDYNQSNKNNGINISEDEFLFDERVAEEAANISDHIISTLEEFLHSNTDTDNNKTVISVDSNVNEKYDKEFKSINSIQSTVSEVNSDHTHDNISDQVMPSAEKYMQSMYSVLPGHLNQSEAGPITAADELATDDLEFQDGANLDLDFFTQAGSIEGVLRNSLTRDSIYVKFDPIVSKIISKTSNTFIMPLSGEEKKSEGESESTAANNTIILQEPLERRTEVNSPALEVVQKLISLTPPSVSSVPAAPNKLDQGNNSTPISTNTKSSSMTQEHLQKELKKLEDITKEREIYFQTEISKKNLNIEENEMEFKEMSSKKAALEEELLASTERESKLKKELIERTKSKQQLSLVMEEYEKTISQLVAQKEDEKKEFEVQKELLMKERDTAMQHLNNMEIAFNDIHQKYERSKTVIEGMKANEDSLKVSLADYNEAIQTSNTKYESLKNHAILQLEKANQELDIMRRTHQAEIAKLKAMIKKSEVRVTSLEESLEQKSKENQELAAICDELINKVGSSGN